MSACRVVKLSSPYLNVMIITGAILFYIDVILFGIDERTVPSFTVTCLCMVSGTGAQLVMICVATNTNLKH